MQITITDDGTARVDDADNLKALEVVTGGRGTRLVADALAASRLGRLEGEHAWLRIDALRAAARGDRDEAWVTGFDGMIGYAHKQGWTNDAGEVRAHLA